MKYKSVLLWLAWRSQDYGNNGTSPFWYENTDFRAPWREIHDLNHESMLQMEGVGSYAGGKLCLSSGLGMQ
jgi:hypothetical protein